MAEITLDIAKGDHECDVCLNANFRREGSGVPQTPCVIYALTIGAGFHQPSYLCPNCIGVLRFIIGPAQLAKRQYDVNREAMASRVVPLRVLVDNAGCNREGE